ncbi:hypothetical protein K7432_006225 [Basidiobolus ranarum]|uniref:Uncharacterized protein n=1 Tax=Basidiobolus ranarum TaxID=34480 RepID=A0ABR2WVB2_9FUNG
MFNLTAWKLSSALLIVLKCSLVMTDVIVIQSPQPNSTLVPGSTIPLSYRVSYQDISLLRNVTVELQDANGIVIQRNIDTSTRPAGEGLWVRNISWIVPTDLPQGLNYLRAYGDASYHAMPDWKIQWVVREAKTPLIVDSL